MFLVSDSAVQRVDATVPVTYFYSIYLRTNTTSIYKAEARYLSSLFNLSVNTIVCYSPSHHPRATDGRNWSEKLEA